MRAVHVVNISGGKDSTACYLLAIERGRPFRAVMADTGHEHPITMEFVQRLPERTGGPEIEIIKADFTRQMEVRRRNLPRVWGKAGVPQERIDQAIALMHPTGNPFLDLCVLKGRFPSSQRRFCTEELKSLPLEQWQAPILDAGNIVRWQGERRAESLRRSQLPMFHRVRWTAPRRTVLIYRPLIHWQAEDCFALHARHGLDPNPLYREGMRRVGCFPCIDSGKAELSAIARRFPEAVDKLMEWERIVGEVSKRGAGTFFAGDTTPEGRAMSAAGIKGGVNGQYPSAREVFRWAGTTRGGRQFDLLAALDDGLSCSSQYGLCE